MMMKGWLSTNPWPRNGWRGGLAYASDHQGGTVQTHFLLRVGHVGVVLEGPLEVDIAVLVAVVAAPVHRFGIRMRPDQVASV